MSSVSFRNRARAHGSLTLRLFAIGALLGCGESARSGSDTNGICAAPCQSAGSAGNPFGSGGAIGGNAGSAAKPGGSGGSVAVTGSAGRSTNVGSGGSVSGSSGGNANATAGSGSGNAGASTGTGGMPSPEYMLVVEMPTSGMSVSGKVVVSGWARGFMNVEVWDATHQKPPLAQATPGADGSFMLTVDASNLASGATIWTIWGWDSPPGMPAAHSDSVQLMLTIGAGSGTAGMTGSAGMNGSAGMSGSTGGRNFILGFYSDNKTDGDYHTWLGYYPEVNYGGSYQVHQPGGGFYPPSVKYPTVLDADISSNGAHMSYSSVASGAMDSQLNATIDSIPSDWYSYIYAVRIDSEFNLENDYSSVPASTYVQAADHVIALYKAKLPARVKYIWNPNVGSGGDLSALVPTTCDVIGVDSYANPTWKNTSSVQFGDKSNPAPGTIWWWTKIAQQKGKAIALPEWGDDYGDGIYVHDVAAWAADPANNVVYLGYWDSTDGENGSLRGASYDAFKQEFANKPYTGTLFAPLLPTSTNLPGF